VQTIIETSQKYAYRAVNIALIKRNWLLGRRISEEEMQGNDRAEYVAEIIKELSIALTNLYGNGFNKTNLYTFTEFYKAFPNIFQSVYVKSNDNKSTQHFEISNDDIFHSLIGKLDNEILYSVSTKSFTLLTWTHFRILLQVKDPEAREWYMKEAADQTWSVRTLQRNISSQYYFRLLKSQNKEIEGDNPTLGIILCADTDEDIARYSILKGNEQLFASKYKTYLPSEEELRAEIENQKRLFYLQQFVRN